MTLWEIYPMKRLTSEMETAIEAIDGVEFVGLAHISYRGSGEGILNIKQAVQGIIGCEHCEYCCEYTRIL